MNIQKDDIMTWLEEVKDPEIPTLSVVDLGVITGVDIEEDKVQIEITPTFVGCPALDMMKTEIGECLSRHGIIGAEVVVSFRQPWTSDRITEKGKAAIKRFGIGPPPSSQLFTDLEVLETASCPRCNGSNTSLKNPFGPTLCRSIHYCHDCREAFEQFKPI
jgi:ring-1,2-phenylacetyl-CoA epoxidase subunit PaaD